MRRHFRAIKLEVVPSDGAGDLGFLGLHLLLLGAAALITYVRHGLALSGGA